MFQEFEVYPLPGSAGVDEPPHHVCLGISPFNSYFSTPRIAGLIRWALPQFSSFNFYIPDEAAAYTLQAMGYDADKALKKARRQGQYVKNKILTAMDDVGLDADASLILDADKLRDNEAYIALHAEACRRFEEDAELRADMMTTSAWILDKRLPEGVAPTKEQNLLAVQYFLEEVPMFANTPAIVGQASSTFVYHQRVDFLERFYGHQLNWKPADGQSFWVVSDPEPVDMDIEVTEAVGVG